MDSKFFHMCGCQVKTMAKSMWLVLEDMIDVYELGSCSPFGSLKTGICLFSAWHVSNQSSFEAWL